MWWMPSSCMNLKGDRPPLGLQVGPVYAFALARVRVELLRVELPLVLARVCAAFFAAALRLAASRLRVAAAFFAAAWRLAGPPFARSSRSATTFCRSAMRAVAALEAREPWALLSASESSLATRLRTPLARNLSNSASAWDLAIGIGLLSGVRDLMNLPVQEALQSRCFFRPP